MRIDVSIIIVNYNTLQLTLNCIHSIIQKTSHIKYEIIVVDNASTDGSREVLEKEPNIRYFYSTENLGFGKANNLGYKFASGSYLFLLNSDTVLLNNAIEALYLFMENHREVAIAGGSLYNEIMQPCHSYGVILPSLYNECDILLRGILTVDKKQLIAREISNQEYAEVGYITGADMMLRREYIEEVGLFDPDFFMYYEETEMTFRYMTKGYKSAYLPKAMIQHLEGRSFSFKETRERMYLSSRKLYYKKTGKSLLYYYCCTALYIIYMFTSMINDLVKKDVHSVKNTVKKIKLLIHT